jgi:hypothetical protein
LEQVHKQESGSTLVSRRSEGGRLDQDWCLLALHASTLTNVVGEQTRVKYKLIPKAGQFGLGPYEAA